MLNLCDDLFRTLTPNCIACFLSRFFRSPLGLREGPEGQAVLRGHAGRAGAQPLPRHPGGRGQDGRGRRADGAGQSLRELPSCTSKRLESILYGLNIAKFDVQPIRSSFSKKRETTKIFASLEFPLKDPLHSFYCSCKYMKRQHVEHAANLV